MHLAKVLNQEKKEDAAVYEVDDGVEGADLSFTKTAVLG